MLHRRGHQWQAGCDAWGGSAARGGSFDHADHDPDPHRRREGVDPGSHRPLRPTNACGRGVRRLGAPRSDASPGSSDFGRSSLPPDLLFLGRDVSVDRGTLRGGHRRSPSVQGYAVAHALHASGGRWMSSRLSITEPQRRHERICQPQQSRQTVPRRRACRQMDR